MMPAVYIGAAVVALGSLAAFAIRGHRRGEPVADQAWREAAAPSGGVEVASSPR